MRVIVDSDACPVQKEIIEVTETYDVPVTFVKSYSHFSHEDTPSHVKRFMSTKATTWQI